MKKGDKFTDYESALINNLNIASVDEAVTLIPSLKDKFPNTEILATRLAHLQDFQKSNDDTNYNVTSYAALSQNYHNTSIEKTGDESKENDDDDVSMSPSNKSQQSVNSPTYSQTPQSVNSDISTYSN
eukprot:UN06417